VEPAAAQTFGTATIILLTVIIIALIAALPRWPYSRTWGYRPAAIIGTLLMIVFFLLFTGVW
jgi:hypothetical protein